jgi:hypothetical protein
LRSVDFSVWVDQFDILPSQLWDRTVEAALRDCTGLLLVLSPRSVASENVLDEVSIAIQSQKRIIPVLYEKCTLPLRLARVQFIDATGDYAAALERCKAAISGSVHRLPAAPVVPPAVPAASAEPLSAEIIDTAAKRLAPHVGPIASVLTRNAAALASTEAQLYSQLAASIPHAGEREAFLKGAGQAALTPTEPTEACNASTFEAGFLDQIARVLVHHLGPLARHVVTLEQEGAADREDLYQRLAGRVPHARERTELLRKLRAL